GRTEDIEEKRSDTVGGEGREEPTPCLTSESRIGSTDHEYDDCESSQSNRPSPSHLESDDEYSEGALANKGLFMFKPSSIKGQFALLFEGQQFVYCGAGGLQVSRGDIATINKKRVRFSGSLPFRWILIQWFVSECGSPAVNSAPGPWKRR
ncbi:hypothetical protein AVEN_76399-1, partial [Araneus ventricosus]